MKEFKYKITDQIGIHARPAGLLVKEASKFKSQITLIKGDKSTDAKKLFSVMGMGVKFGEEITIKAEGADEEEAATVLEEFFRKTL